MTDLEAYKKLPELRESLKAYKRALIRKLELRAKDSSLPMREAYYKKISKIRDSKPHTFRAAYISERVSEICGWPTSECRRAMAAKNRHFTLISLPTR